MSNVLQTIMFYTICSKGTSNVLRGGGGGGGQWSAVKDHIFTFFWDPYLRWSTFQAGEVGGIMKSQRYAIPCSRQLLHILKKKLY